MLFVDLRVGSKPVMKSGQRARAAAPAGVAGQHIHPSHVPGQYESAREYKRYRINWIYRLTLEYINLRLRRRHNDKGTQFPIS